MHCPARGPAVKGERKTLDLRPEKGRKETGEWLTTPAACDSFSFLLPAAEALKAGISEKVLEEDYHKWRKGLNKGEMKNLLDFYKQRYGQ